jgi:hypothetical protein
VGAVPPVGGGISPIMDPEPPPPPQAPSTNSVKPPTHRMCRIAASLANMKISASGGVHCLIYRECSAARSRFFLKASPDHQVVIGVDS